MSNSVPYTIARLSFERLGDMERLYQAVYSKTPAPHFFKQKYDTAFTGTMYTGFLAYDANKAPAAFYGVIPCFIRHHDGLILAAQSADTMTHPDHRNKGLFVQLANLTYALCREEGIRMLFGFPNQNSLHGFVNKLNWQVNSSLESFRVPVKTLPLEKAALKFPLLSGFYKFYVRSKLKKLLLTQPGIANSVISEGFSGVHRDAAYLSYKTFNTTWAVKAGPAAVWFKIQNGLVIGDIIDYEDNFDAVIKQLKQLARGLGVRQLHFQACGQTRLHGLLKKYALPNPSFPVIIKDLGLGLQPDKIAFTMADIDIF